MAQRNGEKPRLVNFLDGHSLYGVVEYLRARTGVAAKTDYLQLRSTLDAVVRPHWDLAAAQKTVAFLTYNPNDQRTSKFHETLKRNDFLVVRCPYVDVGVTPSTSGERETIKQGGPVRSLAVPLSYAIGQLAERQDGESQSGQIVAVTGAHEIVIALQAFVERGGQAVVAWPRSLLDPIWTHHDALSVFDDSSRVSFFDLGPYAREIFGVDIPASEGGESDTLSGL